MVESKDLFPAEGVNHSKLLITEATHQILLVWREDHGSHAQLLIALVWLELLDDLDVSDFVLAKDYLINLNCAFKGTLPQYQMISILRKQNILGIKSVWQKLMKTAPVL